MSRTASERWVMVRRLFEAAVELPCEQREAFLSVACGNDDGTRSEVVALLAADESAVDLPVDREVPRTDEGEPERLPEIVGFRIDRRLGAGGTSRVYEATCWENGNRVALKVMNVGSSSQALMRFRQESRILSRLRHPGIVSLHESGHTADGQVYLAMDFVEGDTIDRWCAQRDVHDADRVGLAIQVLEALAHAHGAGVIHRDIKPHNILVGNDGLARLVDFGVARLHREDGNRTGFHTETGNLVGTFAYMSPEQADGKASRVGPATDVYQVALVLYELLTGRLPYEIEDRGAMALLKAVLFENRVRLSERRPELAGPLDEVLHAALDVDPTRRPATAMEFSARLAAALPSIR